MADRISELRIEGLRTIEKLHLRLDGLTVLIGENGSGKSSIIEACQILKAAAQHDFLGAFHAIHGGPFSLMRHGTNLINISAIIQDPEQPTRVYYDLAIERTEEGLARVRGEQLQEWPEHGEGEVVFFLPAPGQENTDTPGENEVKHGEPRMPRSMRGMTTDDVARALRAAVKRRSALALTAPGPWSAHDAVRRTRAAFENIEVHVPFETTALWASRARTRRSDLRSTVPLQPTERLDLFGANLANAYFALKERFGAEHWATTLEYIRLGLGSQVERVVTPEDPGGGAIGLQLEVRGRGLMPASVLSDGELAYLACVALFRLQAPLSLLAFDEPDLHLHPGLLARVVQLFEAMSERHPVLVATHSDALLDALSDPAKAVRVCELEQPQGGTVVRSLDSDALSAWLRDYRGVGHVRADGLLPQVLAEE